MYTSFNNTLTLDYVTVLNSLLCETTDTYCTVNTCACVSHLSPVVTSFHLLMHPWLRLDDSKQKKHMEIRLSVLK